MRAGSACPVVLVCLLWMVILRVAYELAGSSWGYIRHGNRRE